MLCPTSELEPRFCAHCLGHALDPSLPLAMASTARAEAQVQLDDEWVARFGWSRATPRLRCRECRRALPTSGPGMRNHRLGCRKCR